MILLTTKCNSDDSTPERHVSCSSPKPHWKVKTYDIAMVENTLKMVILFRTPENRPIIISDWLKDMWMDSYVTASILQSQLSKACSFSSVMLLRDREKKKKHKRVSVCAVVGSSSKTVLLYWEICVNIIAAVLLRLWARRSKSLTHKI